MWYVTKVLWAEKHIAEGPMVAQFEKEFGEVFIQKHVVMLNSGTSALELAYDLAGLKAGDEVISPVLTCTATNIPLVRRGCKIVFADIDYDLNINIEDVKKKLTKRTKAIVFVHFGGNNRGLADCIKLGHKYGIPVIEDAAQAVGSPYWGKADFAAVSMQAIKTITAGDGGVLICKRAKDYEKAKRLKWYGYDRPRKQKEGDIELYEAGYKFHANDVSAAIALGNLRARRRIFERKEDLAETYMSYGLFAHAWLAGGYTEHYDELKQVLARHGFDMGQHHFRNDRYKIFGSKGFPHTVKGRYPIMDELEHKYFFVPFHPRVEEADAYKIARLCEPYLVKTS